MIISPGRCYVFVHAPKTGGTALSLALEARAMKDDILIGDTPKAVRRRRRIRGLKGAGRIWKHSTLADVQGVLSVEDMDDFFVVMLVRNPWDRVVSYYHWLRQQDWEHAAVGLAKSLSFDEFVKNSTVQSSFRSTGYASYVTDGNGVEHCDLFIRLEHLAEDISPFEAHLGFSLADIEHINTSARDPDYRKYYSEETAVIIGQICQVDINRFGYEY